MFRRLNRQQAFLVNLVNPRFINYSAPVMLALCGTYICTEICDFATIFSPPPGIWVLCTSIKSVHYVSRFTPVSIVAPSICDFIFFFCNILRMVFWSPTIPQSERLPSSYLRACYHEVSWNVRRKTLGIKEYMRFGLWLH